jgi:hypothetical protein
VLSFANNFRASYFAEVRPQTIRTEDNESDARTKGLTDDRIPTVR